MGRWLARGDWFCNPGAEPVDVDLLGDPRTSDHPVGGDALPMHLCDWAIGGGGLSRCWAAASSPMKLAYFLGTCRDLSGRADAGCRRRSDKPVFSSASSWITAGSSWVCFSSRGGLHRAPARGRRLCARAAMEPALISFCAGAVGLAVPRETTAISGPKPAHSSLLDFFGRWPWYILTLEVSRGSVFFCAFAAPFLGHRLGEIGSGNRRGVDARWLQ